MKLVALEDRRGKKKVVGNGESTQIPHRSHEARLADAHLSPSLSALVFK